MSVVLDHLVVAAATLEQGVAWCESTLGITPGAGGKHPLMGTHNRLFKIATAAYPQAYFEVIAIDPEAATPPHPRWFGLSDPALQTALRDEGPRLIHSVARSTMLDMHRWGLITVGMKPGDPVNLERGAYRWQMLVRDDGGMDAGGALPTLLQWQGPHPSDQMLESGVTLRALALSGVNDRARDVLRMRGVVVSSVSSAPGSPGLRATLATPNGEVILESR